MLSSRRSVLLHHSHVSKYNVGLTPTHACSQGKIIPNSSQLYPYKSLYKPFLCYAISHRTVWGGVSYYVESGPKRVISGKIFPKQEQFCHPLTDCWLYSKMVLLALFPWFLTDPNSHSILQLFQLYTYIHIYIYIYLHGPQQAQKCISFLM